MSKKKKNNISGSSSIYEVVKKIRGVWSSINPITKFIPNKKKNPKIKHKGDSMMKYELHYVLYNCKNIIRFRELSQYTNWTYVMEKEFREQFKLVDILDLEHERRK